MSEDIKAVMDGLAAGTYIQNLLRADLTELKSTYDSIVTRAFNIEALGYNYISWTMPLSTGALSANCDSFKGGINSALTRTDYVCGVLDPPELSDYEGFATILGIAEAIENIDVKVLGQPSVNRVGLSMNSVFRQNADIEEWIATTRISLGEALYAFNTFSPTDNSSSQNAFASLLGSVNLTTDPLITALNVERAAHKENMAILKRFSKANKFAAKDANSNLDMMKV